MMQFIIALDQLINTLFRGWADETVSARAHRNAMKGVRKWIYGRHLIDTIFFWDKEHCRKSFYSEKMRSHLPAEYREARLG